MSEVTAYKIKKGDFVIIGSEAIRGKIKIGTYLYISQNDGKFHTVKNENNKLCAIIVQLDSHLTTAKERYTNLRTWFGYSILKAIRIVLRNFFNRQCKIEIINN